MESALKIERKENSPLFFAPRDALFYWVMNRLTNEDNFFLIYSPSYPHRPLLLFFWPIFLLSSLSIYILYLSILI